MCFLMCRISDRMISAVHTNHRLSLTEVSAARRRPVLEDSSDDDAATRERLLNDLFEAIIADDADEVEDLLDCGIAPVDSVDGSGRSVLMKACYSAHSDLVTKLLELGASVDLRDCGGSTALRWVCECIDEDKEEADLLECATALLDARADVNAADLSGTTPLMRAVGNGRPDLASCLLSAGADGSRE